MDTTILLIVVCGLSLICTATVAIAAYLFLGFSFGGILGLGADDGEDETDRPRRRASGRRYSRSRRPDLRAKAESLSMDAVEAKYGDDDDSEEDMRLGSRRRRRYEAEDEITDILDEEGEDFL